MPEDVISTDGHGTQTASGDVASRLLASGMNVNSLRTNSTLRKEEWLRLDEAVIRVARERLRAAADLMDMGLTMNLQNGLGTTVLQWEQQSDPGQAQVSMDGLTRGRNDRPEWKLQNLPLPITHSDFQVNLRALEASRRLGETLDVTMAEAATRRVAEQIEDMVIKGDDLSFGNGSIYGYTNAPNRVTMDFSSDKWDDLTGPSIGEDILKDVLEMMQRARNNNHFGPYALYIPRNFEHLLDGEFKENSDRSLRERLNAIGSLQSIRVLDRIDNDNVLLVDMRREVVDMIVGLQPTTVQWSAEGGMVNLFKVMSIMVPRVKWDYNNQSGIVHLRPEPA